VAQAAAPVEAEAVVATAAAVADVANVAPIMAPAPVAVAVTAPIAPAPVVEPVRVEPFVLPLNDLSQLAQAAGLEWVNSDADKIRTVQEAIAAEPKPAHVPRERKPVEVVDTGPLILVETRKDISQIKLPFENAA
jgi:ribonuclease E